MRMSRGITLYFLRGLLVSCGVSFIVLEAVQGIILTIQATEGVSFDFLIMFPVLLRAFGQALCYTLPLSLVFGAGLLVGRLNADRETTALRSCGFSELQLLKPVLILGVCFTLLNLLVNFDFVPRLRFANRNVGSLILEQLGYLGEGWNLEYRSGARNLWIYHYNGPVLDGLFLGVAGEGPGAPVSKERLEKVQAAAYPICLFAEKGYVFRGTGELEGRVVVSLQQVSVFFDNDFLAPDSPSNFMNRVRVDQIRWTPQFSRKPPGFKDLSVPELREKTRATLEALGKAEEEGTDAKKIDQLRGTYAIAVTEFHRRLAMSLTALTFPVAAFILGLYLRSTNRLLPFFLSSAIVPSLYFGCEMVGNRWAERGLLPWATEAVGNIMVVLFSVVLLALLRRGPR